MRVALRQSHKDLRCDAKVGSALIREVALPEKLGSLATSKHVINIEMLNKLSQRIRFKREKLMIGVMQKPIFSLYILINR